MNKIKTFIKDVKEAIINNELPQALRTKSYACFITGFLVTFAGLLVSILFNMGMMGALLSIIMGLLLIFYGCFYKYLIYKKGYELIEGICIERNGLLGDNKILKPNSFVVEAKDEIINISPGTNKNIPPLGCKVAIYVAKDSPKYSFDGKTNYGTIFGFETIPDNEE